MTTHHGKLRPVTGNPVTHKKADLSQLMLDAAGYRKSQIVMAGIKFDIFTAIESLRDPRVESIAGKLNLTPRSVEKLLSGLVALTLVERHNDVYRNSATAREYLLPASPTYVGFAITTLYDIGKETWSHLTSVVEKGKPATAQRTDEPNAKFWQNLTKAIRPFSLNVAQATTKMLGYRQATLRKVLDIGGGSGVFGGAFLEHFPEAQVVQVDWPAINDEARKFNRDYVDQGRFTTINSNFFADDQWGSHGPFDVVILSHIVHQESPERIVALLKKINNHLAPDGNIIINEYYLNHQKNYPPYSLIFDLSMLLQNEGGAAYSFDDANEWLAHIGHEISLISSPVPPATVAISMPKGMKDETKGKLVVISSKTSTPEATSGPSMLHHPSSLTMPPSFNDRRWDYAPYEEIQALLLQRLQQQLRYAAEQSPYWRNALPKELVNKAHFSLGDFHTLPILTKDTLRLVPSQDLLSAPNRDYYVVRASSGTTGKPVPIYWTKADWQAAIETSVRFLAQTTDWHGLRFWNGYHQGHVAGPAFDDIIRMLGATPIPRHFNASDAEAIADMGREQVKALVIPPNAGTGKGGSLEDLLATAPDFITRYGIHTIFASSTDFSDELIAEVKELGVTTIFNFYGTTEGLPTAISCRQDARTFHLAQGHILLEVVDEHGKPVKNGERGQIVMSRIGSSTGSSIGPVEGTMLFRYRVGDSAVFHSEACRCGATTPRISQLRRNPVSNETFHGGCEKWE